MIVVYTTNFGEYDKPAVVPTIHGVRFVAFTDSPHYASGWECLRPNLSEFTHALEARKYKCRPHLLFPSADWTIYIDANIDLTSDPRDIVQGCEPGLNVFRHNRRDCLYDEAKAVRSRVSDRVLEAQLSRYRNKGFPEKHGLYWGGLIVRSREAVMFNECWWSEVLSGVCRDQVSLPYAAWNTRTEINVLPGDIPFYGGKSPVCVRRPHKLK